MEPNLYILGSDWKSPFPSIHPSMLFKLVLWGSQRCFPQIGLSLSETKEKGRLKNFTPNISGFTPDISKLQGEKKTRKIGDHLRRDLWGHFVFLVFQKKQQKTPKTSGMTSLLFVAKKNRPFLLKNEFAVSSSPIFHRSSRFSASSPKTFCWKGLVVCEDFTDCLLDYLGLATPGCHPAGK